MRYTTFAIRVAAIVAMVGLVVGCGSPDKEAEERMKAERAAAEAKAKKLAEATKPDPAAGAANVKINKGQLIDKCAAGDAPSCQGACALEDGDSCARFATMFEEGNGVPEDFEAARDFHQKGCTFGSGQACYSLGLFYKLGKSSVKSPEKAAEYFAAGCKLGFQPACDEVNGTAEAAPPEEKK